MPTDTPPPRRKWNITRLFLVLAIATLGWSGWQAYAFRSALAEAKALGWEVEYTDPVETIRKDWKAAFKKATWTDGVVIVEIPTSEEFEKHLPTVQRLNPMAVIIYEAHSLQNLSSLQHLPRLEQIIIFNGTVLTNVDALKDSPQLQYVQFDSCTALTNLDGLRHLKSLQDLQLGNCPALKNLSGLENHTALKALWIASCDLLTDVDELKGLVALERVGLTYCTALKNVDALKHLPVLQFVDLAESTALEKETIVALKAALPKATIQTEYDSPTLPSNNSGGIPGLTPDL